MRNLRQLYQTWHEQLNRLFAWQHRALCRVYGLSIDYFDLPSTEACQTYLLQAQAQHQPLLQTISQHAAQLSADDRHSISSIIRWIQARDTR